MTQVRAFADLARPGSRRWDGLSLETASKRSIALSLMREKDELASLRMFCGQLVGCGKRRWHTPERTTGVLAGQSV